MSSQSAEKSDAQLFRFDQSAALLRKVMDEASVGMTVVGLDGRMIYANTAYARMLGKDPAAIVQRTGAELMYEPDREIAALHFARLIRGEVESFSLECRTVHADGNPIWIDAHASLLRSEATGQPMYVVVQVIDIDRQKRAEAALAANESRWNYALESAKQGVWDHDVRTDDMFYSRMWREMRGFDDGEAVDPSQESWLSRVHPEDVPRLLSVVKRQDSGEEGYDTIEYRERHRDGHYVWILSRGKPVEWDADGKPTRVVGTDTDITHLKNVEAALAQEKERLRVTLESIGDGVISTDADERVIFMNPIAEAMTGWLESDALGRRLGEVFVAKFESTGEPASDPVADCLASAALRLIGDDVILASRDGIGRGVGGTAAPVRTEDGSVIGAVLVFKDVTDVQEAQRRLAHSASHDPLTGLPNRSAFDSALLEARHQVAAEQRQHALCFIDLDGFKAVNDGSGHAAGDALLKSVAQVIRRTCRMNDFAARLGGDEFVLLLADCPLLNAAVISEKIVASIRELEFRWGGKIYGIGASVGIAPITADPGHDVLAEADAACYVAKGQGRGRVSIAAA